MWRISDMWRILDFLLHSDVTPANSTPILTIMCFFNVNEKTLTGNFTRKFTYKLNSVLVSF